MLRVAVLATAVLALAGSASSVQKFDQQGTTATPRAPYDDGQAATGAARVEVHAGTTIVSAVDTDRPAGARVDGNAAAVTLHRAGGSARVHLAERVDLQLEGESAWGPTASTPTGASISAPDAAAISATAGLRIANPIDDRWGLGVAIDLGGTSVPIRRTDRGHSRNVAPLGRIALVPSLRQGDVTFFGVAGASTEVAVPPEVIYDSVDGDPGVQADASGVALTLAAGATVDLHGGTKLTARVGDAWSARPHAGHYGPQVDVGLSFALDR